MPALPRFGLDGKVVIVTGAEGGHRCRLEAQRDVLDVSFARSEIRPSDARARLRLGALLAAPLAWLVLAYLGSLAVHGTVNDLAMCGAEPVALSVGFVLEEGFAMNDLRRVVASMAAAAVSVGVPVVTGVPALMPSRPRSWLR